jgi:hypothetical protein
MSILRPDMEIMAWALPSLFIPFMSGMLMLGMFGVSSWGVS